MESDDSISKKDDPSDEERLPKEIRKIIDFIPDPEKRREAEAILSSEITLIRSYYSGPLPPAEQMEIYERTHSGSADRIIAMTERQQAHRIEMEKLDFPIRNRQFKTGQIFSFIIGIVGLGTMTYVVLKGHDLVGGIIGTISLGLILACFFKRKDRD
jgi:uncharacterized membrane protein